MDDGRDRLLQAARMPRGAVIEAIFRRDDSRCNWRRVDGLKHCFAVAGDKGVFLVGDGGKASILTRAVFGEIAGEARSLQLKPESGWLVYAGRSVYSGPRLDFVQIGPELRG